MKISRNVVVGISPSRHLLTFNFFLAEVFVGLFTGSIFPFAFLGTQQDTVSPFSIIILSAAVPVGEHGQTRVTPWPRPVQGFVPVPKPRFDICEVFKESLFIRISHAEKLAAKSFACVMSIVPSFTFEHLLVAKWTKISESPCPTGATLKVW